MRTAAQVLREEGRREGLAVGLEMGLRKGQQDFLLRQLTFRFGELPPWAIAKIQGAEAPAVCLSAERLLVATRLEDVFAE